VRCPGVTVSFRATSFEIICCACCTFARINLRQWTSAPSRPVLRSFFDQADHVVDRIELREIGHQARSLLIFSL
jgi:hypothetical protein